MPRFAHYIIPALFGRRGDPDAFEVPKTEPIQILESAKEVRDATPDEYRLGLLRARLAVEAREQSAARRAKRPVRPYVVVLVRGLAVFEYVDRLRIQ